MSSRHVLITMDFPPIPGGISNYLYHLWTHLDLDRSVLMCGGVPLTDATPFPIQYAALPHGSSSLRRHLRTILMIPLLLWKFRNEKAVLHCGQVIACGLAALVLNIVRGNPYVLYLYGAEIYSAIKRPFRRRLLLMIIRRAAKVVVISKYTLDLALQAGCPKERLLLVNPGVEPVAQPDSRLVEKWRTWLPKRNGLIILSVARLVQRKGHLNVLKALHALLSQHPELLYLICGNGPYRPAIEQAVETLGLKANVVFCGHVPDHELPALYSISNLFVLTPFEDECTEEVEGFGIVYLEANTYGKPVIGSRSGGIPDAIEDGVSGILVSPQDPEQLTSAIKRLLEDAELGARLGNQGKCRAEETFRWSKSALTLVNGLTESGLA